MDIERLKELAKLGIIETTEYIEKCSKCDEPFECVVCGFDEKFIKLSMLDEPFAFVHKYQRVKCPRCLTIYNSCPSCDYAREDKNNFKWDLIERRERERFTCTKCVDDSKKYPREEVSVFNIAVGSTIAFVGITYHRLCDTHSLEFIRENKTERFYKELQTIQYVNLSKEMRKNVKTLTV